MEKIFIACGIVTVILLIATVIIDSFKSFQARMLFFILKRYGNENFLPLFVTETETVNNFIATKPGLAAQMFSSFLFKKIRALLLETDGFDREKDFFLKNDRTQEAAEVIELRDRNIASLYIALGCPQL